MTLAEFAEWEAEKMRAELSGRDPDAVTTRDPKPTRASPER